MSFFSPKFIFHYLILIFCFLIAYPYVFDAKLFLGGDNANYYILANSLANGDGYAMANQPLMSPANHFPPGYPFIMSLVIRIGLSSIIAMKVLNGILLLASSILFYQITFKITKIKLLSLVLSALMLLNANLLEYSSIMMSEISFLFTLLLTFYFFLKAKDKEFGLKNPYTYLMLVALVLLMYIRSQGLVFFIALIIYFIINKQFKPLILCFSIIMITQIPWQIRSANLGGNSYMKQVMKVNPYDPNSKEVEIGDWTDRVGENFVRYISKEIPKTIFPKILVQYKNPKTGDIISPPFHYWLLGFGIMLFALLGIWAAEEHRLFLFLLFGGTFAIHMLWPPVWYGIRFLLPMTPFILLTVSLGIFFLLKKVFKTKTPDKQANIFALCLIPVCFLSIAPIKLLHAKAEVNHPAKWNNFLRLGEWAGENLGDSTIICVRKPGISYVTNKFKSKTFPYSTDPQVMFDDFDENKVTHILIEQLGFRQTGLYLAPLLQKDRDKFKLVKGYDLEQIDQKNEKGEVVKAANPNAVWLFEYLPKMGFQGKYVNGLKQGKGKHHFTDGRTFEGNWEKDTIDGFGNISSPQLEFYEGNWVKGKKEGSFIYSSNGKVFECYYKNDAIEKDGYLLDKDRKRIGPTTFR
ncbi:MAG: hypothetical protein ACI9XP_001264 [Lentimonas sp.]|jgi:hypothetical protein